MHLLKSIRFFPLFLVQFLGAFNDNVFKNAFVMLITFKMAKDLGWETATTVNMIMVLFLLPSLLFSAIAGQIADKFEKARTIQWTKIAEIGIMVVAAVGFWLHNPWILMLATFGTGAQSALFGPLKYGILPQHLKKEELVQGTSLVEASTFVAILVGTILGGLALIGTEISTWLPIAIMLFAIGGYISSLWIPPAAPIEKLSLNWNIISATKNLLQSAKPQVGIWRSMLGLSWFWALGSIWLAFIPTYTSEHLGADNLTATAFIAIFSIGIGVGALACQKLLKGEISAKYVPLAGVAISGFTFMFVLFQVIPSNVFDFFSIKGLLISSCLFGIAVASGIFSVPLYTIIQAWSDPAHCSRNIAANNILNALFIVIANLAVGLLALIGLSGFIILSIVGLINLVISIYIIKIIPESVLHTFLRWILQILFRVKVEGLENYKKAKERKVIIANHVSYLDAALLTAFLPELPTFAVNTHVAQLWWVKPILQFVRFFPVDPSNPMAIKSLTAQVKNNVPVAIFPEGRLTVTGRLMKVYEGPGMMAIHAEADIVPIQINGAQFSKFSYLKRKLKQHWFPDITITILPPVDLNGLEGNKRKARADLGTKLYNLMNEMAFDATPKHHLLFEKLLEAMKQHGAGTKILNDHTFSPLNYRQLVAKALTLSPKLLRPAESTIGLLLPNSKAAVVSLFALQAACRVTALLNFSLGPKNLVSTCKTALIKTVWTSEKFISEGKFQEEVKALMDNGITVRYLESIPKDISMKLRYILALLFPTFIANLSLKKGMNLWWEGVSKYETSQLSANKLPAIILFTSGSSGTPKAVVLSHYNIISNIQQLLCQIDINRDDTVFNCLPMFHSFGLTGGTLCPLLGGVPVMMYPSPIHYRIIPEIVYQSNATILFGTNTFLNGYSKKAHPYDFHSVRYIFAGAEKVKPETKALWSDIFGVRILEGYGTTECSPALCMNTPMFNEPGTVGRFLPGIKFKTIETPGMPGGRLLVSGPNIMLGYYLPETPGELEPPEGGWYDTGDIVEITEKGFVKIIGRAKRFAKIGGEMISLTAVEELAGATWPNIASAAISVPHESRGEEIILFTEQPNPKRNELLQKAKEVGAPELCVPKVLIECKIPTLGTGKPDYITMLSNYNIKNS